MITTNPVQLDINARMMSVSRRYHLLRLLQRSQRLRLKKAKSFFKFKIIFFLVQENVVIVETVVQIVSTVFFLLFHVSRAYIVNMSQKLQQRIQLRLLERSQLRPNQANRKLIGLNNILFQHNVAGEEIALETVTTVPVVNITATMVNIAVSVQHYPNHASQYFYIKNNFPFFSAMLLAGKSLYKLLQLFLTIRMYSGSVL